MAAETQDFLKRVEPHLTSYCDVRRIGGALHSKHVIDDDQFEEISPSRSTKKAANTAFYKALQSDPSEEKLRQLVVILRNDKTHANHQHLADMIVDHLQQVPPMVPIQAQDDHGEDRSMIFPEPEKGSLGYGHQQGLSGNDRSLENNGRSSSSQSQTAQASNDGGSLAGLPNTLFSKK